MSRFVLATLFFVILAATLLGGLSSKPVPQLFAYQDWLHHVAAFTALVFSARLAFAKTLLFWTVLYCVLLALFIELAQGLLPERTPSIGDMLANIVGVLMGMALALLWKRQLRKRQEYGDY